MDLRSACARSSACDVAFSATLTAWRDLKSSVGLRGRLAPRSDESKRDARGRGECVLSLASREALHSSLAKRGTVCRAIVGALPA